MKSLLLLKTKAFFSINGTKGSIAKINVSGLYALTRDSVQIKPKPGAYRTTPTQDPIDGASDPYSGKFGIIAAVEKPPKSGRFEVVFQDLPSYVPPL